MLANRSSQRRYTASQTACKTNDSNYFDFAACDIK
jgi:hypothetical protein